MVFNSTCNNISVISCWSVLLVEEFGLPGENHRPAVRHWQTLSHNVVSSCTQSWKVTCICIYRYFRLDYRHFQKNFKVLPCVMREEIKWTPKVNTKLETCGLSPLIRNKEIFRLSPLKRKNWNSYFKKWKKQINPLQFNSWNLYHETKNRQDIGSILMCLNLKYPSHQYIL